MKNQKIVLLFLRLAIASVFYYAAIASFIEPDNWIGYLPQFLRHIFPATFLLSSFSLYEFFLATWIMSGWKSFYSACLASLTLIGIIISNITLIDIVFRDIAIFFASLALATASWEKSKA